MIKNLFFSLWLMITCLLTTSVFGQGTEIFNYVGGGSEPSGWVFSNNITSQDIDKETYWLLEAGNTGDYITTSIYNLSAYSSVRIQYDFAAFGNGTQTRAKIEISYNGGETFSETHTSSRNTDGSSPYFTNTYTLLDTSNKVVLRFKNNL